MKLSSGLAGLGAIVVFVLVAFVATAGHSGTGAEGPKVGKPMPEVAPNSAIVKALKPLVAALDAPAETTVANFTGLLGKLGQKLPRSFRKK